MKSTLPKGISLVVASLFILVSGHVIANDASLTKTIDGVDIYMGITHTDLAGQSMVVKKLSMVGGLRGKKHHLTVSLFDSETGKRITDAKVTAQVGELGLSSNRKKLKHEKYGDAISYGRDFYLSKEGPYWIDLKIKRNGVKQATTTRFEWKHF